MWYGLGTALVIFIRVVIQETNDQLKNQD